MLLPVRSAQAAAPVELSGNHIVITGDAQDFTITSGGNLLFDIPAMLPGETTDFASLTIQNTQDLPFTVNIGVTDEGSNSDLLAFLNIVVRLDGVVIASFPAKGQTGVGGYTNPYPVGRIPAATTTRMRNMHFPMEDPWEKNSHRKK
jgi:hypothetical protein